jgi:hypothetical protein
LLDRLDHEARANFDIVSLLVSLDAIELSLFRRHQQLEHEQAGRFAVQGVREPLQASCLALVQILLPLGKQDNSATLLRFELHRGRTPGLEFRAPAFERLLEA